MTTILPTVILFERHSDLVPKEIMQALLPKLAQKGYDTLCVEAPFSMKGEDIIAANRFAIVREIQGKGLFLFAGLRIAQDYLMSLKL